MKARVLSILVFTAMVALLIGVPVQATSIGQTWYINGDSNSGDAFTSLTTNPATPARTLTFLPGG